MDEEKKKRSLKQRILIGVLGLSLVGGAFGLGRATKEDSSAEEPVAETLVIDNDEDKKMIEPIIGQDSTKTEEKIFDLNSLVVIERPNMNGGNDKFILNKTEDEGIYEEIHGEFKAATIEADSELATKNKCISIDEFQPLLYYLENETLLSIESMDGKVSMELLDSTLEKMQVTYIVSFEYDLNSLFVLDLADSNDSDVFIVKETENQGIYEEIHHMFNVADNSADEEIVKKENCIKYDNIRPLVEYLTYNQLTKLEDFKGKMSIEQLDSLLKDIRGNTANSSKSFSKIQASDIYDINSLVVMELPGSDELGIFVLNKTKDQGIYEEVHHMFKVANDTVSEEKIQEQNCIKYNDLKPFVQYLGNDDIIKLEDFDGKVPLQLLEQYINEIRDNSNSTITEITEYDINSLVVMELPDGTGENFQYILNKTKDQGIYKEIHNTFNIYDATADEAKAKEENCVRFDDIKPLIGYLNTDLIQKVEEQNGKLSKEQVDSILETIRNKKESSVKTN